MSDPPVLKIIVLGDSGVGKSSLLNRYVNNTFSNLFRTTMGADYFTKQITVDGCRITLQIWDTAGQERFQSLGTSFYRGADCCVLTFDLTRAKSFESLQRWKREFLRQATLHSPEFFPFVVIGNKVDLTAERCVDQKRVVEYCDNEDNTCYYEVSARDARGLEEAFKSIAKHAYASFQRNTASVALMNKIRLNAVDKNEGKSCWNCFG